MIINWSFDPVLVSAGPFAINWYALLFVGSFLVGKAILSRIFTLEGVPQENAERLFVYVLLGAIIGARLVHCLFYDPQYYLANPLAIFRTWEGACQSWWSGRNSYWSVAWCPQDSASAILPVDS